MDNEKLTKLTSQLKGAGYSDDQVSSIMDGVAEAEDKYGYDIVIGGDAMSRTVPDAMVNKLTGAGSLGTSHIPSKRFSERSVEGGRDATELNEALGIEQSEFPQGRALPGAIDIKIRGTGKKPFDESEEKMQVLHHIMRSRGLHPAVLEDRLVSGSGPSDPYHFEFGGGFGGAQRDMGPYNREISERKLSASDAQSLQSNYSRRVGGKLVGPYVGQPAAAKAYVQSLVSKYPTKSELMADSAVTAALSEKSAKLAQESTKPSEPSDGSDIMPRPQLVGVLQSMADMGYDEDVLEYITTSQDPSQPARNVAVEMGDAYKTDPMNDGSVKYGVYIPGSGLGKSISEPAAGQVMRRVMSSSGHPRNAIHSAGMNSAKVKGEIGKSAEWGVGEAARGGERQIPVWKATPGERSFSDLKMSELQKIHNPKPPEDSAYWATDQRLAERYQSLYGPGSEIDAVSIPQSILDDLGPSRGQVIIPKRYTK